MIALLMVRMQIDQAAGLKEDMMLKLLLNTLISGYLFMVLEPTDYLERPIHLDRTIESFSPSDCHLNFRFGPQQLRRLFVLMDVPHQVTFYNRSTMSGEEVFLRGLYELCTGATQHVISGVFGREGSSQSRAFCYFIEHMYNRFHHLVHDNLLWWRRNGFFTSSAEAIAAKIGVHAVRLPGPDGQHKMVSHFIDCNCMPTSVVGGGPAQEGAHAARWNDTIQRAFYNGWKSVHRLKHQTVNNAYGFTVDMCGPTSLRRNDLVLLLLHPRQHLLLDALFMGNHHGTSVCTCWR